MDCPTRPFSGGRSRDSGDGSWPRIGLISYGPYRIRTSVADAHCFESSGYLTRDATRRGSMGPIGFEPMTTRYPMTSVRTDAIMSRAL